LNLTSSKIEDQKLVHPGSLSQARAVAMIYPEAKRGGDRKSSSKIELELPA